MIRSGTPAEQLERDLRRMRQHGIDFDDAWLRAWSRIRWPHATGDRRQWKAILLGSRHIWRAAYYRHAAPSQHTAVAALVA